MPPVFTEVMNDPEGGNVTFKIIGTDHFKVDPISGNVTIIKALDHEVS